MISKTAPGLKVSGSVIPGPYHNDHVTKTVIYKLKKGQFYYFKSNIVINLSSYDTPDQSYLYLAYGLGI